MKAIYLCEHEGNVFRVFSSETLKALIELAGAAPTVYSKAAVLENPDAFAKTEYIFSTWGMPAFSEKEIRQCFPKLKAIFYAAGTVQNFARPFLKEGIKVFSAWKANAVPVAEYTVSQILLANKGFFASSRIMKAGDRETALQIFSQYRGNYGERVGLIGVGTIGSLVAQMLREYRLEILAFDPFLSSVRAKELGVRLCSLAELFSSCSVISNHLANNTETQEMLDGKLFSSMRPYATFLNTGRGAQVKESELVQVLQEREDLTAVLDVTNPEPPIKGHPFYTLPNCILTPHIAGSAGDEVHRMAEYMLEEFERHIKGEDSRYEVSEVMLKTMA